MILDSLQPEFREKVDTLLATLKSKYNLTMVPIQGLRTLEDQAKTYRQGRTFALIEGKINWLRQNNANYLADILEHVGPQQGDKIVTNALPGYSWHNWGYALDCYVSTGNDVKGKPILLFKQSDPLYQQEGEKLYKTYADEAIKEGLTAGYYFTIPTKTGRRRFEDAAHIQLYNCEIPSKFTLQQVNDHFESSKAS